MILHAHQGGGEAVGVAAREWAAAPQRAAQAIDRLMALRVVSGADIARWAFGSPGLRCLDDEVATGLAWEVLFNAVNKTLARTQVPPVPTAKALIRCRHDMHCVLHVFAWKGSSSDMDSWL